MSRKVFIYLITVIESIQNDIRTDPGLLSPNSCHKLNNKSISIMNLLIDEMHDIPDTIESYIAEYINTGSVSVLNDDGEEIQVISNPGDLYEFLIHRDKTKPGIIDYRIYKRIRNLIVRLWVKGKKIDEYVAQDTGDISDDIHILSLKNEIQMLHDELKFIETIYPDYQNAKTELMTSISRHLNENKNNEEVSTDE